MFHFHGLRFSEKACSTDLNLQFKNQIFKVNRTLENQTYIFSLFEIMLHIHFKISCKKKVNNLVSTYAMETKSSQWKR